MKANKRLMSGLLGMALLAMPMTAAAHSHKDESRFNRQSAPAYRPAPPPFRAAPVRPYVATRDRGEWMRFNPRGHDRDDWNRDRDDWNRDRDDWSREHRFDGDRHFDRDDYRWQNRGYRTGYAAPYYAPSSSYYPDTYQPYYGGSAYGTPYYGEGLGGGLANLIRQRDNAQILYQQALRNGNRVRAKHLYNDIKDLNKRIARAGGNGGYGYSAFNAPYANTYDYNQGLYGYNQNSYGYDNGLTSLIGPLLGGYTY